MWDNGDFDQPAWGGGKHSEWVISIKISMGDGDICLPYQWYAANGDQRAGTRRARSQDGAMRRSHVQ